MYRILISIAAGVCVSAVGYVIAVLIISYENVESSSIWLAAMVIWLLSMLLSGYVVSAVLKKSSFFVGWISGLFSMLVLALFMKQYLKIDFQIGMTLVGFVITSLLPGVGSRIYGAVNRF